MCWLEWTSSLLEETLCLFTAPASSFLKTFPFWCPRSTLQTLQAGFCGPAGCGGKSSSLRVEGVLGGSWGDQLFLCQHPHSFPSSSLPSETACSASGYPPPFSSLGKHRSWWMWKIFILNFWNNIALKIPSNQILANHFTWQQWSQA